MPGAERSIPMPKFEKPARTSSALVAATASTTSRLAGENAATLVLLLPAAATDKTPRPCAYSKAAVSVCEAARPPHEAEMMSAPMSAA